MSNTREHIGGVPVERKYVDGALVVTTDRHISEGARKRIGDALRRERPDNLGCIERVDLRRLRDAIDAVLKKLEGG